MEPIEEENFGMSRLVGPEMLRHENSFQVSESKKAPSFHSCTKCETMENRIPKASRKLLCSERRAVVCRKCAALNKASS
ncbi:unnamed protein product [Brugia pahangi]|uniref:Stc1 domain-containing protein n=1 Tax=Brugia pahangi TaxID=6280 RepID=A0A0N4SZB9_BRUPA|nr:unnamed protein product [Brugia pahangi]